ncbi:Fe-S cluster assembly protein IscX [Rickettsia amblyommatis]|uniref:Fe-S cluster assembly protein IscX n=1 Tax=Rickettsia amblyommatis TaxID=33989 RepID=UPI00061F8289|nr:Fe-S cluster assembly protein IscX [Rickettsia amblyommatis]KJV99876.1 iron-sulfur cluster assembly family protein [Rickettsia amblyommatis str. Darkwater]
MGDIEEIAEQLEEHFSDQYNEKKISLLKLEKLIRDLKDFENGEKKVEEVTLEEILDKWEELREEIREID